MGYDVRVEGYLRIPAEKVEAAAQALYAKAAVLKGWSNSDMRAVCTPEGLEAAVNDYNLSDGNFFVRPQDDGSVLVEGSDDYVRREEEDEWIFEALAPFMDNDELGLEGEDGERWLYRISGGKFEVAYGTTVYGNDAKAPEVVERIVALLYLDGKPLTAELDGSDAIGTLYAIESLVREHGFGPQAGLTELERMADV